MEGRCTDPPAKPDFWHGSITIEPDGREEHWAARVEVDRVEPAGNLFVTFDVQYHDGTDEHAALLFATPDQAEQMAGALMDAASALRFVETLPPGTLEGHIGEDS